MTQGTGNKAKQARFARDGSHGHAVDNQLGELDGWLREVEPMLHALWKNMSGGILLVSTASSRTFMANPEFCRMLGYSESELRALAPLQLHPAEGWPRVREIYSGVQTDGDDPVLEMPFLTKGGGIVYAKVNPAYFTIKGESCFLGVVPDINVKPLTAKSIARSQTLLAEAQGLAHLGSWNLDLFTGEAIWSDEEFRLLGYEPGAVPASGEIFIQAVHPDDRDAVSAEMRRAMALGETQSYHIEHRVLRPEGERILEQRGRVISDEAGRPLRMYGTSQDITEQKHVQAQLRAERNFSSAVLDSAGAIVLVLDRDGRILRFNHACQTLTGYSFAEVEGRFPWDFLLLPNEGAEVRKQAFNTLVDDPESQRVTYTNHWLDRTGGKHLIEWHNTPLVDDHGRLEYLVSIGIDVTEKHAVEAALRRSEETYARAEAIAHIGSWDWDIGGGGLLWTAEVYRIFGLTPQSVGASYAAFLQAIHPDDRAEVVAAVDASVADDQVQYSIEHRVLRPDGTVRHVHERGKVYRDEVGTPLRMIGSVHDITERKLVEQELERYRAHLEELVRERTAELMQREQLLRDAQAIAHLGHWSVDVQSGELAWSDEIYRIFGYLPGTGFTLTQERFLAAVHPDDLEPLLRAQETTFEQGGVFRFDHRIVLPDGAIRWVHAESVCESDSAGRPLRLTGTVQDITARKHAEAETLRAKDEAERAKEEAERANRAKSVFLSRMSHELRTPLNAILGFGQLLDRAGLACEQADNVREILHAGGHLLELINEVLDLARIESGKFTVSKEALALSPLLAECLALMRPQAEQRRIELVAPGPQCDRHVLGDRIRLKQVLLNLLSNAVKYNRAGGTVTIACAVTGDTIRIAVSDSGPGLGTEQQARLFEPFERLGADQTAVEGSGIGLALSKRLVELMDGSIGVDGTLGAGSTFWLELPATVRPDQPGLHDAAQAEDVPGRPAGAWKADVLCIEDNPANVRLITRILAYRPEIRLLHAATPSVGLALARSRRPTLILLDISLPEMDGFGVLACLREDPATHSIPVVAISANAMPEDLARGRAAGFVEYLTKPLDVKRFLEVIDRHMA